VGDVSINCISVPEKQFLRNEARKLPISQVFYLETGAILGAMPPDYLVRLPALTLYLFLRGHVPPVLCPFCRSQRK
jgi:hypothetical protein